MVEHIIVEDTQVSFLCQSILRKKNVCLAVLWVIVRCTILAERYPTDANSIVNFGGALLLNVYGYRPQIGLILKVKSSKGDQVEVRSFIYLGATLL